MASPPIKRTKRKTVPLGEPFDWDGLTKEQQTTFGTPDSVFIVLAQARTIPIMAQLLNATLKETLEG